VIQSCAWVGQGRALFRVRGRETPEETPHERGPGSHSNFNPYLLEHSYGRVRPWTEPGLLRCTRCERPPSNHAVGHRGKRK
jgi:hypothetical protein